MRQNRFSIAALFLMGIMMTSCSLMVTKAQKQEADKKMETIRESRDYERMLVVADSLEQVKWLSTAKACYWRGYAYDRLKQQDKAADYWTKAMEASEHSKDEGDQNIYVKAASRLANQLVLKGDFDGALKVAQPVAKRLQEEQRDTTSDYQNLLIYIGCSLAVTGKSLVEAEDNFTRAYNNHMANIERTHSDEAYKNAIAGLINIAYYCVTAKNYRYALHYTRHFGVLLGEYEQRPGVNPDYIDRQLGRYDIYKAQAQKGLGRKAEADETYAAFQETKFSKTPEGQSLAEDYLASE